MALQRALIVSPFREDGGGTHPLHQVEGYEGGIGAVAVHPSAGSDQRGKAIQADGGQGGDGVQSRCPQPRRDHPPPPDGRRDEQDREGHDRGQAGRLRREPRSDEQDEAAQQGTLEEKVATHAAT